MWCVWIEKATGQIDIYHQDDVPPEEPEQGDTIEWFETFERAIDFAMYASRSLNGTDE